VRDGLRIIREGNALTARAASNAESELVQSRAGTTSPPRRPSL
jgi:hypothetical protein